MHTAVADALSRVRIQADNRHAQIVRSAEISRSDRELLITTGWLQEIMRGWYMLARPDVSSGDTAAWYANFWDFIRIYLDERFGENYCLSAESSLDLHTENPIVPKQLIVIIRQGAGGLRHLMHNTSLMMYLDNKNFPNERTQKQGIRVMSLGLALCKASPAYFQHHPREAELALRSIKTADEITKILIKYHFKTAASRLIGAYYFIKDDLTALQIKNDMATGGVMVSETNPFLNTKPLLSSLKLSCPFAGRITAMWAQARETVIEHFPVAPGLPVDPARYLQRVVEIYPYDAYHSLSIEGYRVTKDLIEKVKNKQWDPLNNINDYDIKNAMAAKGYFDAFQEVKQAVEEIITGGNAALIVKANLQKWYQKLFGPSVKAGILSAESLFGYRHERVYIRNSRHSPPASERVLEAMEALFACLQTEQHPGVNAVLGHYFFVYIHPYMDGNGRLGRFLMNALLASGGYPWTVIWVEDRNKYITSLENTHLDFDMTAFTQFVRNQMKKSEDL